MNKFNIFASILTFLISPVSCFADTPPELPEGKYGDLVVYYIFDEKSMKFSIKHIYEGDRPRATETLRELNTKPFINLFMGNKKNFPAMTGVLHVFCRAPFKVYEGFLEEALTWKADKNEDRNGGRTVTTVRTKGYWVYNATVVFLFESGHAWKLIPNPKKIPIPSTYPRLPEEEESKESVP